jgi:hypothetical protein
MACGLPFAACGWHLNDSPHEDAGLPSLALDATPVLDAAPEPDAAVPPAPAVCAQVCGWLAQCAAAPDERACPGVDSSTTDDFEVQCRQLCAFVADFDRMFPLAAAQEDALCDPALGTLKALSRDFAVACAPSPPPENAVCVGFGERVAECVSLQCAAIEPVRAGLVWWMTQTCDEAVAVGDLSVDEVPLYAGPEVPCDGAGLSALVGQLLAPPRLGGSSGPLSPLCTGGPARPFEVCARACDRLGPCVGATSALGEPDYCALVCAVTPGLADAFACAAAAPECGPLSTCFAR